MKKIRTKFLPLLLALVTILSLLPTSAFAASKTGSGIQITQNQAYWSTRLLANGTPYSYRPPLADGKLVYCMDSGLGYHYATKSFLDSFTWTSGSGADADAVLQSAITNSGLSEMDAMTIENVKWMMTYLNDCKASNVGQLFMAVQTYVWENQSYKGEPGGDGDAGGYANADTYELYLSLIDDLLAKKAAEDAEFLKQIEAYKAQGIEASIVEDASAKWAVFAISSNRKNQSFFNYYGPRKLSVGEAKPDQPEQPTGGTGKITLKKTAAGTLKGLPGARYSIYFNGQIVGSDVTGESGELHIIKAMLKAGVMEERAVNEEGTPQGGLISPLLANVYLDIMDEWVSKQWENKRTRHQYVQDQSRYAVMRKKTTLVPGYLVRYADDFIIATDTRAHAEDWKARLQSFLQEKMKLTLSQEKTLITDIRKKYIKFLGYEFKMVRGKSRRGYIPRTIPDRERLKRRADKIAEDIKKIPGNYSREQMVGAINRINSQIRGIIQYYQCCTWVNIAMQKHSRKLQLAARRRLKQYNGKWIPANQTRNLPRVHQQYKQKIPSIKYRDIYVGFTALTFCRWERTPPKNQAETPYTDTGRQLYFERTKKKKMQARLDEMYSDRSARAISYGKWGKFNNFEFIMNRAYALNRDKLRCRVCGGWLIANTPWAHRINPYLPLDKVNRVNNLISLHKKCFIAVNNPNQDISEFDVKAQKKIVGYRDKLVISHTRNK